MIDFSLFRIANRRCATFIDRFSPITVIISSETVGTLQAILSKMSYAKKSTGIKLRLTEEYFSMLRYTGMQTKI